MDVLGWEQVEPLLARAYFECKLVFNAEAACFFSGRLQHRDQKVAGLSYEDDYRGNALAAMVKRARIEVRYHERFDDEQVGAILRELLADPRLAPLAGATLTYQGRVV